METDSTEMPRGTPHPLVSSRIFRHMAHRRSTDLPTLSSASRISFSTSSGTVTPSHLMNRIVFSRPHGAKVSTIRLGAIFFCLHSAPYSFKSLIIGSGS